MSLLSSITCNDFLSKPDEYPKTFNSIEQFLSSGFIGCEEKHQLCDEILSLKSQSENSFIRALRKLAIRWQEKAKKWVDEKIRDKEFDQLSDYDLKILCRQKDVEFKNRLHAINQLDSKFNQHKHILIYDENMDKPKDPDFLMDFSCKMSPRDCISKPRGDTPAPFRGGFRIHKPIKE